MKITIKIFCKNKLTCENITTLAPHYALGYFFLFVYTFFIRFFVLNTEYIIFWGALVAFGEAKPASPILFLAIAVIPENFNQYVTGCPYLFLLNFEFPNDSF